MITPVIIIHAFDELNSEDLKLISLIRQLKFGSIEITVRNSKPVMVKKAIETIQLEEK